MIWFIIGFSLEIPFCLNEALFSPLVLCFQQKGCPIPFPLPPMAAEEEEAAAGPGKEAMGAVGRG